MLEAAADQANARGVCDAGDCVRHTLTRRQRAKRTNKRKEHAQGRHLRIAQKDADQRHQHAHHEHPYEYRPSAE